MSCGCGFFVGSMVTFLVFTQVFAYFLAFGLGTAFEHHDGLSTMSVAFSELSHQTSTRDLLMFWPHIISTLWSMPW